MAEVKVIYGSTTGNTERAAGRIAAAFGVEPVNVADAAAADFQADLIILGCSTWGFGELQDDWVNGAVLLEAADLNGKKVALFGTGDQQGFSDTYCDALGILAGKARSRGAEIVGATGTEGYGFSNSAAVSGGEFCGLALDDDNQPEMTEARIDAWVNALKE